MYVNDAKILDCEYLSANPKKRFTVPEALKKFTHDSVKMKK